MIREYKQTDSFGKSKKIHDVVIEEVKYQIIVTMSLKVERALSECSIFVKSKRLSSPREVFIFRDELQLTEEEFKKHHAGEAPADFWFKKSLVITFIADKPRKNKRIIESAIAKAKELKYSFKNDIFTPTKSSTNQLECIQRFIQNKFKVDCLILESNHKTA